jgi:excisionase family DNA binding protein
MMKSYLVEARFAYEVQADTADEALRLVSLMILDHRAVSVEYSVREKPASIVFKESQPNDLHGLSKPIYTVSETASLLGTSRHSVYELVRRGLGGIRMGRRVLIPRGIGPESGARDNCGFPAKRPRRRSTHAQEPLHRGSNRRDRPRVRCSRSLRPEENVALPVAFTVEQSFPRVYL